MPTVAEIIHRVSQALPPDQPVLTVTRKTVAPPLPASVQEVLAPVWHELSQLVPPGIDYALTVSGDEAILYLASLATSRTCPLKSDAPLAEQLRSIAWNELRTELPTAAEPLLSASVSTKALQKLFGEDVRQWIKEVRRDAGRIHLLYYDETPEFDEELDGEDDEGPRLDTLSFPNMTAFLEELEALMRNEKVPISVVSDGKPWSAERIDRLKREIANRL